MRPGCRILVVDDEPNIRRLLEATLSRAGYEVDTAPDGETGLRHFTEGPPDLVLMDLRMPGLNGLETLREMRTLHPQAQVILMTAYASVETAVEALRNGAFDYIIKPFDLDEVTMLIERALQVRRMTQDINLLHRELSNSFQWGHFLTHSPRMMELCRDTARIAQSMASVLISGESGTGKELIARAIHYNSRRATGPLVKINCGALPETLLESELFGHERGAFTGAHTRRAGIFERASGGTVFLDEVGEMSPALQVKLLRILQEREFERVGGMATIKADVRVIAATNRDLQQMVRDARFRCDLYYRLNVIHLQTLPLRERPEDIALLADHFLQKFCAENNKDIGGIDSRALALLRRHGWPGNVRELANAMERAVIMSLGAMIFPEDLPEAIQRPAGHETPRAPPGMDGAMDSGTSGRTLKENLKDYERELIRQMLRYCDGNRIRTARELGISRRSLMYKLQEYRLD